MAEETDLKFFTNEPERDLYSRFTKILQTNTQFFDVLFGYFRTSGFFKLYPAMSSLDHIRILVGLNVDKFTVDIIDRSTQEVKYGTLTSKEVKEAFESEIQNEFARDDASAEIEKGVLTFIEWFKSGKMEMRMYTKAPLHAKVYIMRKDPEKSDYLGSVITGSSNFSEAGLQNNLEFNVELRDSADVKFALSRFEELWNESVPIQDTYIDAVEKKTWMRNDITPYEIYLKTLYEFFKEEINADKDKTGNDILPDGFMRLQYQIDAVIQAKKILKAYNGVFISDVVGLGKTFICAMLMRALGRTGKKLVICPPVLKDYWEKALLDFDVSATVESLGKLDHILNDNNEYTYIFVDEAHRFRNANTENFSKLHEICYGKKVILISATPINNYSSDIANQLFLFQPKHKSTIPGVPNLEGFFAELNGRLKGIKNKNCQEYMDQIRANSEVIRDKVLRHVMIRRTRHEIEKYYKDDLEKQGLHFPKLGSPEQIVYEFDDTTDAIFKETIVAIKDFKYSRYKPLTYLKDTSGVTQMLSGQISLGGFMKGILVKRLESSFYAFRMTLDRFEDSYRKFIEMYEKGEVYISKKVDVYELLDSGDDDKLEQFVEADKAQHYPASAFKPEFIVDLKRDLNKLEYLQNLWDGVKDDQKLDKFKEELKNNKKLKGNKKIIFTESKETAEYLQRELQPVYGGRVVAYSGSSSVALKNDIEDSFNPKYEDKGNDKYDILITTDVLAEGINLHRSNALVNYDLPWNPTRIMQRVGRINRVGTKFDEIYVFNFFPTAQSSKQMPLKERIMEKLQAFHDTLGEDYKYLSEEEVVSSQKLFEELNQNMDNDGEGSNPELHYLVVIRQIRDQQPDLFKKIKELPRKSKTGRNSEKVSKDSTITFIRKGALKDFYITSGKDSQSISFMDAVKYLECEPSEPKVEIGTDYYDHYDINNHAFDESLTEDEIITAGKAAIRGNDATVLRTLRAIQGADLLTDDQDAIVARLATRYENGDIPQNISKNIVKALKTSGTDVLSAYYLIMDQVPDEYIREERDQVLKVEGEKQVILSCYLKASK